MVTEDAPLIKVYSVKIPVEVTYLSCSSCTICCWVEVGGLLEWVSRLLERMWSTLLYVQHQIDAGYFLNLCLPQNLLEIIFATR